MLFERQRDVEMIDALVAHDVGGFVETAEERQAAVAEMVAAGPVVDEADDLIAELAMLEDLVRDHASELAGTGDEDAAQPDAGHPAPLERLAHDLARQVAERDVEDEEDRPDRARHFVRALIAERVGHVIGADIQRRDDAEDDGDDAADEDVEEVVDARPAAPQAIQALQMEGKRDDRRDERQDVEVLRRAAAGPSARG